MNNFLRIQQTIREDFKDIEKILTCPKGVEESVWKYEHLRQFCMELNGLAYLLLDSVSGGLLKL
jgi:hypothetical protein